MTRKFGQEVIAHIAGKRIHGTGVIPGGMNKALSAADRDSMRAGIDKIVDWSKAAVGLVIKQHETNPEFYKVFGELRANMMGLVDRRGAAAFVPATPTAAPSSTTSTTRPTKACSRRM